MSSDERDNTIRQLSKLIPPIARRFSRTLTQAQRQWFSYEDLVSEGVLAVIRCVDTDQLTTQYVKSSIRNALIRVTSQQEDLAVSLSAPVAGDEDGLALEEIIASNSPTPESLCRISEGLAALTPVEADVLLGRLGGYTYPELAQQLDIPRSTVQRIHARTNEKFSNVLCALAR
jgi:RNA polymerase sigma factor (sigma-70 family)